MANNIRDIRARLETNRDNKKKELRGILHFENGKKINIPLRFMITEALNGKECTVTLNNGVVVKIVVDEKEIGIKEVRSTGKTRNFVNEKHRGNQNEKIAGINKGTNFEAHAPFNFVPLNKIVVPAENEVDFSNYNGNTGYIDCKLETITPLYIGMDAKTEKFFNIKEKPVIPGSSLRGMIRTLVQIVSWSKFKFFNNETLHFRWLAGKKELREYYGNRMSSIKRNGEDKNISPYKFNAGYLVKNGFDYFVIPAKVINKKQFQPIEAHHNKGDYFRIKSADNGKFIIISGPMVNARDPRKSKHKDWEINPPLGYNSTKFPVQEEVIKSYRNDNLRNIPKGKVKNIDPLERADAGKPAPCFYVTAKDDNGKEYVRSFGHTGYFRLSYEKTIGDHIIQKYPEGFKYDIDEAIFGKESEFSGRVFFEDAELLPGQNDIFLSPAYPKILSSPKPTAVQLYLEQNDQNRIMHYDDDVAVRGYKLYWHRDHAEWRETDSNEINRHRTQYEKKIQPIRDKVKFKFRIRFENLSDVELGALLFVLNLPENHYHKLGMGKPLGLGSVKITPQLFLSDRKKRYERLFDENKVTWNLAESEKNSNDFKKYENAFEKYMLGKIDNKKTSSVKSLWDTPRLKQLKIMLDWDNTKLSNWNKMTEYMDLTDSRWRNRAILPYPEKVVQLAKQV